MADPRALFALFVSCVDGQPVTRFGTRTMIGATRTAEAPDVVVYDTTQIVGIPHDEYGRNRRAYDRALGNGSLVKRGADEFAAQSVRDASAAEAASKAKKARRDAAAAEAKAAPAASPSLSLNDDAPADPPPQ